VVSYRRYICSIQSSTVCRIARQRTEVQSACNSFDRLLVGTRAGENVDDLVLGLADSLSDLSIGKSLLIFSCSDSRA